MTSIGGNMGSGPAKLQEALQAFRQQADALKGVGQSQAQGASFEGTLSDTVSKLNQTVQATQNMHLEALQGEMDFHEVAAKLKQAQLSFDFSMQVRNKFIDAYREVMRMSV